MYGCNIVYFIYISIIYHIHLCAEGVASGHYRGVLGVFWGCFGGRGVMDLAVAAAPPLLRPLAAKFLMREKNPFRALGLASGENRPNILPPHGGQVLHNFCFVRAPTTKDAICDVGQIKSNKRTLSKMWS